jgi:sugar phosphate isomerase/epimerase
MSVGFSSTVYPGLNLPALLEQAQALGFKAIELHGQADPRENGHAPVGPSLTDPAAVAAACKNVGINIVSLRTPCEIGHRGRRTRQAQETSLRKACDTAAELVCLNVIVTPSIVPAGQNRDHVLGRIVESLRKLAPFAAERRVSILVENHGSFVSSRDTWYILDAVGHPAVRCCWNPCSAIIAGETHSLGVPRVGRQTVVVHLLDATRTSTGGIEQYVVPGQGQIELGRYLLLMHGIAADPHWIVDGPPGSGSSSPREYLTAAKTWLDAEFQRIAQMPELSAYKGDKNAPRYTDPTARATANV